MALPFTPSHTVPAGGLPAWSGPDGTMPAIATLDPGLPVAVAERRGAWARVICSNGWQGWVDDRRLVPLGGPPPGPGLPAAAGTPPPSAPGGSAIWGQAVGQPPGSVPATAPRRGRRGPCCLGCLLILVIVVGVPIGAFAAFQMGFITPRMIMTAIGQGPGYVQVDNLRDDRITLSLADTSTASDAAAPSGATLNSFDIRSLTAPRAGRYRLTVTDPGGTAVADCTLTVHSGDKFMIVVLPDATIVHRNDDSVSQGSELFVTTSSLCR
jgi:hypothetical protein